MTELADTDVLWLNRAIPAALSPDVSSGAHSSPSIPTRPSPRVAVESTDEPVDSATDEVHGWLFDASGRVLVQITGDGFGLPHGPSTVLDRDLTDTLRRRAEERAHVIVGETAYLDHDLITVGRPCMRVWMAGHIERFRPRTADTLGDHVLGRWMTTIDEATYLLGLNSSAVARARAAANYARTRWGLPVDYPTKPAGYVD